MPPAFFRRSLLSSHSDPSSSSSSSTPLPICVFPRVFTDTRPWCRVFLSSSPSYTFIHPYIYLETGSLTDKELPNLARLASKQASRPFCLPPWCWYYNGCTAQLLTGVLEIWVKALTLCDKQFSNWAISPAPLPDANLSSCCLVFHIHLYLSFTFHFPGVNLGPFQCSQCRKPLICLVLPLHVTPVCTPGCRPSRAEGEFY